MATGGQLPRITSVPSVQSPPNSQSENVHLSKVHSLQDIQRSLSPERQISILLLTPWWHFDSYGVSSISKSIISDLRSVDHDGENIHIFCAVLEEEGKIPQDQLRDAEKLGVQLIGAKQPKGKKRKPELQWLDEDVNKYYQDLIHDKKFDFIIGHLPYVANGALNLKTFCTKQRKESKIILMVHTLPVADDAEIDEELLADWLKEADMVFSVGGNVWMHIGSIIRAMDIDVGHKLYLPSVSEDVPNQKQSEAEPKLSGEQNIVIMVPDRENPEVSGLDFELAVVSSAQASQNMMFNEGSSLSRHLNFNLKVITSTEDEKSSWEENLKTIQEKHKIDGSSPGFKFCCPKTPQKLQPLMKRATVVILPLKGDNPVFGTETLNALAAGIPILVSKNSGIASFLYDKGLQDGSVVWDGEGPKKNVEEWKKKLIRTITNQEEALRLAESVRKLLHLDVKTEGTHKAFVEYIVTGK